MEEVVLVEESTSGCSSLTGSATADRKSDDVADDVAINAGDDDPQ